MTPITSVHDLVFLPQVGQAFYHLHEWKENGSKQKQKTLRFVLQPGNSPQDIKDIFEMVYRDTDRNANFAQYLFWDLACFLQGLIEGAAILHFFCDGDIFSSYTYIVPIKSKAV